jgi:hypothetical protein
MFSLTLKLARFQYAVMTSISFYPLALYTLYVAGDCQRLPPYPIIMHHEISGREIHLSVSNSNGQSESPTYSRAES